ncbi:MAG: tRNA dihydrouridine synthase DusB [Gammaproteobacteria bacterium]|nr:tRNA dihydrouridine synthase DusB [Gammaproteobacteria bacterium]
MHGSAFQIGPHRITGRAVLAPMAGLTDQAFRNLCRDYGAAMAVSEMTTADTRLWNTPKSRSRLQLDGENGLRIVQIAGTEPDQMAEAAAAVTARGVDIIDINMGCPAKKVCNKLAGSALMKDETLVRSILEAVVGATPLPVTLKIRTGWDETHKNAPRIAAIAEESGICSLTIHGRTRAGMFKTDAEYDTIRDIKRTVSVPVIANGDIESPEKALQVLRHTGADAVMIGRGALGRPWIFREINAILESCDEPTESDLDRAKIKQKAGEMLQETVVRDIMLAHLTALHRLHGEHRGVRLGRKHLTWYCKYLNGAEDFRNAIVRVESSAAQLQLTKEFFAQH